MIQPVLSNVEWGPVVQCKHNAYTNFSVERNNNNLIQHVESCDKDKNKLINAVLSQLTKEYKL